jgi:hypothetical protein
MDDRGGGGAAVRLGFALASVVFVMVVTAVTVAVPGGVTQPEKAQAHHLSCFDFWQHSGHTDTQHIRWWHCHDMRQVPAIGTRARVHICGTSGTLHGVTVFHTWNGQWSTDDHAHGDGSNEGC